MEIKTVKVLVQIGRSKKGFGCLAVLYAKLNGERVSWETNTGEWATSYAERSARLWFVAELECSVGDKIEISSYVKTPDGMDERNTWSRVYEVDDQEEVQEIREYSVGHRRFPILKGQVREVMSLSKHDERMTEIESLFGEISDGAW